MSRTVLVVDDDPVLRAVARMSLELGAGHRVLEAESAQDALPLAVQEQPDLVLLDVVMPGTDGPATFALLQQDSRTRGLPVVLLTARVDPGLQDGWLRSGVRGVLTKPFDPIGLPDQLAVLLGWAP